MLEERSQFVQKTVKTGISFGSALAMVISYTTWHSIGWAIFHGLLSWLYVIYFWIVHTWWQHKRPFQTKRPFVYMSIIFPVHF